MCGMVWYAMGWYGINVWYAMGWYGINVWVHQVIVFPYFHPAGFPARGGGGGGPASCIYNPVFIILYFNPLLQILSFHDFYLVLQALRSCNPVLLYPW